MASEIQLLEISLNGTDGYQNIKCIDLAKLVA